MSVSNALRCCSARTLVSRLLLPWRISPSGAAASSAGSRCLSTSSVLLKKRKTAEERKALETNRSPIKIKNKITTFGVVDIWRNMTVQELAGSLNKDLEHVQEVMLYIRDADNLEPHARLEDMRIIREIALKCGHKTKVIAAPSAAKSAANAADPIDHDLHPRPAADAAALRPRPPVVTVMGHVDHGKTTLLDSLRGASVAAGEAGGITQHIGAFTVRLGDEDVTFLDTPGHAAFSAMRARGANCTDIIVLVVAADDGVMEQTRECIQLALAAEVPLIVAVNKCDKPGADVERTRRGLLQHGIALEGSGGDVQLVEISALLGTGLPALAEAIAAQATLAGLRAEPVGPVEGVVIEAKTDKLRGKLATAIVTRGTLRRGAVLVSGPAAWAKVRGLFDHAGRSLDAAPPGTPVEILGWRGLPAAGDLLLEAESERRAHSALRARAAAAQAGRADEVAAEIRVKEEEHAAAYRAQREARRAAGGRRIRLAHRPKETQADDGRPRVAVVLKADVHGSAEAILDVLDTYQAHDACRLDVVHYGVGDVNEGDLELAAAFDAVVYAFAVRCGVAAVPKGVKVREFDIIYRLVDDLRSEIDRRLPTVEVEEQIGEANVLQMFEITEGKREVTVLGCRCVKGQLKKAMGFKLLRQGEVVHTGRLESMRHLKSEVDTIRSGVECGLRLCDQTVEAANGDTLVCYTTKMVEQKSDWDPGF